MESLPQLYANPLASFAFQTFLHVPWVVFLGFAALLLIPIVLLWTCAREPPTGPQHSGTAPPAAVVYSSDGAPLNTSLLEPAAPLLPAHVMNAPSDRGTGVPDASAGVPTGAPIASGI